jgi:hypothetical protein
MQSAIKFHECRLKTCCSRCMDSLSERGSAFTGMRSKSKTLGRWNVVVTCSSGIQHYRARTGMWIHKTVRWNHVRTLLPAKFNR